MAQHEALFDTLYINLIRSGEASGSLGDVLEQLADHRERSDTFRANIVAALTYAIALASVAIVSLFVLVALVIPRFIPLFADADAPLPVLTQAVFGNADFLQGWWWTLALLAAFGASAARWRRCCATDCRCSQH